MTDYAIEGAKWGSSGFGSAGGVVTWAIDATVSAGFLTDITAAFAEWSQYANIQFQKVDTTSTAMIDFTFGNIDGLNRVLGETYNFYSGNSMRSSIVEFDASEGWTVSNGHGASQNGTSFYLVALHEIGHTLGLDHYNSNTAVMNTYLASSITHLTQSDIEGIRYLYGAANFTSTPPVTPPSTGGGYSPEPDPIDSHHTAGTAAQNGNNELLWRSKGGEVVSWNSIGGGSHTSQTHGAVESSWSIVDTGDFSGNGKSDLLWRASNGDMVIWNQIDDTSHGLQSYANVSTNWKALGTADFNGDGKSDILWRASSGDVVTWTDIASDGGHNLVVQGNISADWHIVGAGDFSGDGKADILWRSDSGDVITWNNIGYSGHDLQSHGNVDLTWKVVGTGDFSGDGKNDILWRANDGHVVIWNNISGNSHNTVDLGSVDSSWAVNDVDDYNGDSKADIAWRNTSGDVVTWSNIADDGSHTTQSHGNVSLDWNLQQHNYDIV